MCPISSSPFLSLPQTSFSLQLTGVSCNMLCFPTWVLMRQMNIHEEEADIAVWRLCRGCLCAQGLWWPHFWGICCSMSRHQETLGSGANDADVCVPEFSFGWWLWTTPCQRWSLSLPSSCWWRTAREHETVKRSCCLHSSSYSTPSLWSWLMTNWCNGPPLLGAILVPLLYIFFFLASSLYLFILCGSSIFFLGTYCAVYLEMPTLSFEGHFTKHVARFSRKRLRDACSSCLMCCHFRLCSWLPPLATLFLLSPLFCSSDSFQQFLM